MSRHSSLERAGRLRSIAAALVLACAAGPAFASPTGDAAFDGRVSEAMAYWRVPGLAVAAVRDDEVVYRKAFGVTDVDSRRPVTAGTLFATGSMTKSFTVTVLGMLADEGRLDWDRPVAEYLPEFRLMDPRASREVTPRDLVTHRTGMPRHDVLWYANAFDRREMVRRLRYLAPTTELREAFQYNNLMYMVAGYLAGRLTGDGWERTVRRRVLEPLGMTATRLGFVAFLSSPDIATGYFGARDARVPIAVRNTDEVGPASAVYSTIEDMARYVRFHLNGGGFEGKRLLSEAQAAQMRTPQIDIARDRRFDELGDVAYGMGFYVSTYRGRDYVYHPGFIDGYGGLIALLPDERIGVVVLSNLSGHNPVPKMVARLLIDRLLGLAPIPWVERYRAIEEARKRRIAAWRLRTSDPEDEAVADEGEWEPETSRPPPIPRARPRPLESYAGIYGHPGYGPIQIWAEEDGLAGRFHQRVFPLVRHDGGDVWRLPETVWPLRRGLRFTFVADGRDRIVRLETPLADGPTYPYKVGAVAFERMGSESISEIGN